MTTGKSKSNQSDLIETSVLTIIGVILSFNVLVYLRISDFLNELKQISKVTKPLTVFFQTAILKILEENGLQEWNCVGVFTHFVINPKKVKTDDPLAAIGSQMLGYPCIMFELLGKDLWSYQRKNKFDQSDGSGVSLNIIRQILLQV